MVSKIESLVAYFGHSDLVSVLLARAEVLPGYFRHVAVHETVRALQIRCAVVIGRRRID